VLLQQRHRGAEKATEPGGGEVRLGMVLAATAIAMFATNLDFFALNLSIPGMARELHTSTTDMQWAIAGPGRRPGILIRGADLAQIPLQARPGAR
jgi:hypothetical protein